MSEAPVDAHKPVFLNSVLEIFRGARGSITACFDGTFGRGGHTRAMMNEWSSARMVAVDQDQAALNFGMENFREQIEACHLKLVHGTFHDFEKVSKDAQSAGFPQTFDLMLLDLGVSSPQLDEGARGFSFMKNGPLDMRMDQRLETTAADLVNELEEQDLARLFIEYGEVQRPFRVVRAIVHDRKSRKPFETTQELAGLIERVDGWHKKGSHPATRYFMALRLKVNNELEGLEESLPKLIAALNPGGILAVITFHSLEDRIVKNIFKDHLDVGKLVNKKVIKPSEEEVRDNPRARSAKLRAFEKHTEPEA